MPKFRMPQSPRSESKSIRMPTALISRIEKAIMGADITFTRFVVAACENALEDLEM